MLQNTALPAAATVSGWADGDQGNTSRTQPALSALLARLVIQAWPRLFPAEAGGHDAAAKRLCAAVRRKPPRPPSSAQGIKRACYALVMFTPSQADVRRFFCSVHAKAQALESMDAIETIAGMWIAEHPEYHAELSDVDVALEKMYDIEDGVTNPFLHLSMHLSITEQCSIDQPRGIRQAVELLTVRRDGLHDAHHNTMDCLGQMVWESQRSGSQPDGAAYIDCVQRQATKD